VGLLEIIIPTLIGSAIIVILFPKDSLKRISFIPTVCIGTGLGLGITSSLTFIWLNYYGKLTSGYFLNELGFAIVLLFFACFRLFSLKYTKSDLIFVSKTEYSKIRWLKFFFYFLLVIASVLYVLKTFGDLPYGKWDAWAIWNFRARWLFRGEDQWAYAFSNYVLDSHPDYPLLIPGSVFRLWHYIGKDIVAIPILIAGFYTFGSILLISSSISIIRGENQGYVAGIFMLLATNYFKIGTWQYADIPLAFYILSTIILLSLKEVYPIAALRMMFLTGLTASCTAWTKNEGILFLGLVIIVHFFSDFRMEDWRRTLKESSIFFCGLAPILSTVVFFKIKVAPPNDIFNSDNISRIYNYLSEFDRYKQIFLAYAKNITFFNGGIIFLLVLYFLVSGFEKSYIYQRQFLSKVVLLLLLLGGYFFSFLVSPNSLDWHLNSALDRLLIQTWPSWVFLFFYCVKGPEKFTVAETHK
jgi:hypothetical protein